MQNRRRSSEDSPSARQLKSLELRDVSDDLIIFPRQRFLKLKILVFLSVHFARPYIFSLSPPNTILKP